MNSKSSRVVKAVLLLNIFLIVLAYQADAQSPWLDREYPTSLNVEWYKPTFNFNLDDNDRISFLSSVMFATARGQISDQFWLLAELPFSHWHLKDGDGIDVQEPHTTLGNIYLGGEYHSSYDHPFLSSFSEFGIRLPTMADPDFPDQRGYFTGFASSVDRREAFTNDLLTLIWMGNIDLEVNKIATLRFKGGIFYWIETGDENTDSEIYLAQSIQVHFQTEELGGYFGISGKYNPNASSALSNDDITQLRTGITKNFNGWKGEFYLRQPMTSNAFFRLAYGVVVNIKI